MNGRPWAVVLAALILAIGLALHALLPRYQWSDGVIFDRWTGEACGLERGTGPRGCATPIADSILERRYKEGRERGLTHTGAIRYSEER